MGEIHNSVTAKLKPAFTKYALLNDPNYQFQLSTDASDKVVGAMLVQTDGINTWVISDASVTLNIIERNYPTIEREALAIVWFVKMFRTYLHITSLKF